MNYHLYFHEDFDGIASSAVMVNFLESQSHSIVSFNNLNYDPNLKSEWAFFDFKKPFIILDFLYHPEADWWFDHHLTSFIDTDWQNNFKVDTKHFFDPKAKSTCKMLAHHLSKEFNFKPPEFMEELIKWADKIDSAGYDSAEEAAFGSHPAIRLARATNPINFENGSSVKYYETIIMGLVGSSISEVIKIPIVEKEIKRVESEGEEIKKIFSNISEVNDRVVFVDGSKTKLSIAGFFSYYFYPDINYAMTLESHGGYYHLSIGKNPWRNFESEVNIGEILKKYGGGGHKTIGGLERESKSEILKIVEEVIQYLNDNG